MHKTFNTVIMIFAQFISPILHFLSYKIEYNKNTCIIDVLLSTEEVSKGRFVKQKEVF